MKDFLDKSKPHASAKVKNPAKQKKLAEALRRNLLRRKQADNKK